jgi:hypothetical protein
MNSMMLPILLAAAGGFNYRNYPMPTLAMHQIKWGGNNQRQKRKDRRRAFANGNRKAFK